MLVLGKEYSTLDFLNWIVEVIEDQTIDIEECNINISCQELDHNLRDMQSYINNVIVEAVKHLNKEIQSIKERK